MRFRTKTSLLFATLGLFASVPIVWFFSGLFENSILWSTMPLVVFVVCAAISYAFMAALAPRRFGVVLGAATALLSLVVSVLIAALPSIGRGFLVFFPTVLFAAFFWLGWFVALVGALSGWACRRYIGNEP